MATSLLTPKILYAIFRSCCCKQQVLKGLGQITLADTVEAVHQLIQRDVLVVVLLCRRPKALEELVVAEFRSQRIEDQRAFMDRG